MNVIRGFKTELDPNDRQRTLLLQHAGCARFAFNWGLQKCIEARENGEKKPSAIDLHRELNALKDSEFPWMRESSKCSPQEALRNLDRAYANFFRKCKLKKQGKHRGKVGFPKFKSKKNGVGSFRLTGSIKTSETHVTLPRIGALKLKERKYIPTEFIRILSATVSEHAGRWFVSVQMEIENQDLHRDRDEYYTKDQVHPIVGVDLGIKMLAVCSDGKTFDSPKALKSNLKSLRKANKSLHRKVKGSQNRRKAAIRLSELHYRIANIRSDSLHQITTVLTRSKSAVVIEDLNVSGMLRNHKLARSIADVGFGELRRQLEYKGEQYGCLVIVADRFFPSSKTCSECGWINSELKLQDREWVCLDCGCVHDRDHNAAVNLEQWGLDSLVAVSFTETLNACGESGSGPVATSGETTLDRESILGEAGIRLEICRTDGEPQPSVDFGRF